MKRLNPSKFDSIFKIFLYSSPVIDLLTSLCLNIFNLNITIGIIIRMLFLLFVFMYAFFIKHQITKKKIFYLIVLGIYLCLNCITSIKELGLSSYITELQFIIRIFYLPIILICLNNVEINISKKDLIFVTSIYMSLILIPDILGLSFNAYTQGKVGTIGWFNSANEISAIIAITMPFMLDYLINSKNNYLYRILLLILILYTSLSIGSKIPIIALGISSLYILIKFIHNLYITKAKEKLITVILCLITVIISALIIIPKTNFYKNIEIHLNFLEINTVGDAFSYKFLNRFIFSDRLDLLKDNTNIYLNSSPDSYLLGIGYNQNINAKIIEMDFFDILYRTGIIGCILFLIIIAKNLNFKTKDNITKLSIFIMFIISFLAGHVFLAPAVSIYYLYLTKIKSSKNVW